MEMCRCCELSLILPRTPQPTAYQLMPRKIAWKYQQTKTEIFLSIVSSFHPLRVDIVVKSIYEYQPALNNNITAMYTGVNSS